jgi:3-isopropylmalate/(R)-2-methylmalate dehydratase small subunit
MKPFTAFTSRVVPLLKADVDTDQIIPARFLKGTERTGLAQGLFAGWRCQADGREDPDFVLNQERYRGAAILLAGDNFGCGSSREHAAWALQEAGFRAVLSPRFADIFRQNSLNNGLLVTTVEPAVFEEMARLATAPAGLTCHVDLAAGRLSWGEGSAQDAGEAPIVLDSFARRCLLEGLDRFTYLLRQLPAIEAFEAGRPAAVDTLPLISMTKGR